MESASWFRCFWQLRVSSIKRCLKKVIGRRRISYIELQTVISEIELILNNRPIGVVYVEDHEDALTPNHLVFGRRLEVVNDVDDVVINSNSSNDALLRGEK